MDTLLLRQRRLLALVLGLILVGGLSALATIPRQEDPSFINRTALVITPFPGADAGRVEALVSEVLEDELREIEEIKELRSSSRTGLSLLTIELEPRVEDTAPVWSRIRDALADAEPDLPPGAGAPRFDEDRGNAFTLHVALVWNGDGVPGYGILKRYGEALEDRLRGVPRTEVVRLFGAPEEEIRVTVDPAELALAGLAAADVAEAIARADAKVAAGSLSSPDSELLIEVTGALDSLARIAAVPVVERADGRVLRVGDLGRVERAVADPPDELAFIDRAPAVVVAARMEAGSRIDRWTTAMDAEMASFDRLLPDGIERQVTFRQSDYVERRLGGLLTNLLIGASLVTGVLLITLGWRSALLVVAALPLTSLIALATLSFAGIPIHQMSVTGLIVALGLLVDSAIVMVDAIRHRLRRGRSMLEAVGSSVRWLALPLLSSTATTVIAFLPMVLLPGAAGEFVGAIAISVIVALTASLLLSLTVIPALAGLVLPEAEAEHEDGPAGRRGVLKDGLSMRRVTRAFEAGLDLALRHPRLAILAAFVPPALGFAGFGTLTEQFFPPSDRDQFFIEMRLPSQAAIAETADLALRAHDLIAGHGTVEAVNWYVGTSAPSFYYNMLMNQDGVSEFAQAQVTVDGVASVRPTMAALQRELDRAFPEAQTLVRELLQGPPVSAPVEIRVVGSDLHRLRELGEQVRAVLAQVPEVTHTVASLGGGEPKLWLAADQDTAGLAGMPLTAVAGQLDAALEGATGGTVLEGVEEMPVRVRASPEQRSDLDRLASISVIGPSGQAGAAFPGVPLEALGRFELRPAAGTISRRDGERVNRIEGYVEAGVLPSRALEGFRERLAAAGLDLPPGYRLEIGGDAEDRQEVIADLLAPVGVLITLSIAILVMTFNSFRLAGLLTVVAAQAIGLGLLSLTVFNYPFGIQAVIGLLGSIGVAINDSIIVLSALRNDRAAAAGDPRAIRTVVIEDTSRHIVSTTLTTFGGFLPLILAGGGFWPPFATAIAGGVLLSTVIAFVFVPAAFLLLVRAGRGRGAATADGRQPRRAADPARPAAAPAG